MKEPEGGHHRGPHPAQIVALGLQWLSQVLPTAVKSGFHPLEAERRHQG